MWRYGCITQPYIGTIKQHAPVGYQTDLIIINAVLLFKSGRGDISNDADIAGFMETKYAAGITDEFLMPTIVNQGVMTWFISVD